MTTDHAFTVTEEPRPSAPPRPPAQEQRAGLRSPQTWAELAYAVLDLAPAIAFFVLIVTLLSAGVGLSVIYIGVPIVALALLVARLGGLIQRSLAVALLDMALPAPGWTVPRRPGPVSALGALLRDPAGWRAVGYFFIKIVLSPVTFGVAVGFYGYGLGALSYPLWRVWLPPQEASDGSWHRGLEWWPDGFLDTWPAMLLVPLLGLGVLWCAPRVVRFLITIDRVLIATLLSARPAGRGISPSC
ncbi:MAG: sensor domain-containing protein [Nakamurella sp.]